MEDRATIQDKKGMDRCLTVLLQVSRLEDRSSDTGGPIIRHWRANHQCLMISPPAVKLGKHCQAPVHFYVYSEHVFKLWSVNHFSLYIQWGKMYNPSTIPPSRTFLCVQFLCIAMLTLVLNYRYNHAHRHKFIYICIYRIRRNFSEGNNLWIRRKM